MNDSYETTKATDVLKSTMLAAAQNALKGMLDLDQLDATGHATLTADVAKAVAALELGSDVEVAKSLDYGAVTTDLSSITQGGAMMGGPASRAKKDREVIETVELVKKGWAMFEKGTQFGTQDALKAGVAEFFSDQGYDDDDCLEMADDFLARLGAAGS